MGFTPFKKKDDAEDPPAADEGHTPNAMHDGGHGAHAPNGHHTAAKQAEHQATLNQRSGEDQEESEEEEK